MTKKTKVLATSIASIAMCASIAVGGTFALFTDESEVNIAVTSGKVKMNALVDTQSVALTSLGEEMTGTTWANGGFASVSGGEVTLTNVTPGDKITFNIGITNESTVNVQYRTVVSCVEGLDLFSGLVVTLEYANDVEDSQTFNGLTAYGNWNALAPQTEEADVENVDTVIVTIELPNRSNGLVFGEDNLDNQYQGLSTKLNYRVEAVQGNAGVQDDVADEDTTLAYTANDMELIARQVNSGANSFKGKTVKLMNDITLATATTFALDSEVESNWTPIGTSSYSFQGTFDGQGYTIKNLVLNEAGKSNIGLFGYTTEGAIENLVVENATVVGRLCVGVVAGTPYTSTYSNITVKGDVYVDGMSYVGGVGGKNAYTNWDNITVDVNEGSYVSANSVENGVAYRTYVGGVIGFMGEGSHVISNVTSNIDVIGSTIDVGGIVGIAHYGNTFKNCYSSGDVTITGAESAAAAEEIGGIAGVWHNGEATVTFADCVFEGTLSANITEGVDLSDNTIVGKAYNENGTGTLDIYNFFYVDGVQYVKDGVSGEVGLYLVPADYEGDTVEVAEGVDYIGGYAFAYNSNIETIKLSSSVKYLADRAFRDTSAKTVILNEGLEVIPWQAFRNALNLTTIEIPSTVTTIAKDAFQNSGITELTLPATVTTIEYGGLRDMKEVKTITINGDVEIPVYAARACTKLETVYLNGTNVTFAGKGMIFTNKENGDGSEITVYVKNEVIKERLMAADTAAKDYGGYTIICEQTADENGVYKDENGNTYAYTDAETTINEAISNGAQTVYVAAGEQTMSSLYGTEGVTIIGTEGTVIGGEGANTGFGANFGKDTTIKNITFNGASNGVRWSYANGGTSVFENCVFQGDSTYGFHIDQSNGATFIFNNCTFVGFNAFAGDLEKVEFNNCTFLHNGNYGHTNIWSVAYFNNCTFGENVTYSGTVYVDGVKI